MASVMNLLSVGAALGVMNAVFAWGWGSSVLGISGTAPVEVFLPVIMFSVLFGLSMDYEVFLVSRIHEEWVRTGDNRLAVTMRPGRDRPGDHRRGQHHDPRVPVVPARGTSSSSSSGSASPRRSSSTPSSSAPFSCRRSCTSRTANWWLPRWLDHLLPSRAHRQRHGRRTGRSDGGALRFTVVGECAAWPDARPNVM